MSTKQCVNCPGAVDHSTAECPISPERAASSLLAAGSAELPAQDDEYPPCDYCGAVPDYHPWHGSGAFRGVENPHIHACNDCRHLLPTAQSAPERVSVPVELAERIATHLEWDGEESLTVVQYANKCDALAGELRALLASRKTGETP